MFIGGYVFFKHAEIGSASYLVTINFRNAQGVRSGSDVEFSGVLIGHVEDVQLSGDGQALVRARIDRGVRIPTDAGVSIVSSLLGSTATVEFVPSRIAPASRRATYYSAGSTIPGTAGASFAELQDHATVLMQQAGGLIDELKVTTGKTNKLLDQLTVTAKSANSFLGDPALRGGMTGTFENINEASFQAKKLATDMGVMLHADNAILQTSLRNVSSTTQDMSGITHHNRAKIDAMITNMDAASSQINQLVTHANRLLSQTSETLDQGKALQNLTETLANLKTATEKLNAIEEDVRAITGDKTVQADLRTTVKNVAAASGHTNELITRLNELSGGHTSHQNQFSSQLVFWENFRANQFRTDFDLSAPYGTQNYIRAGVRDLTGDNHLNFQVGQRYNDRASMRAGVYDSKVAIGLDYKLYGTDVLTADLYDPNDLKLDLRQRIQLGQGTALWLGMENIPKSPGFAAGFELSK